MEMETNQILTELKYYYRYYKCLVFDYYFTMIDTTTVINRRILSLFGNVGGPKKGRLFC